MESKQKDLSKYDRNTVPNGADMRFGIVVSEWNPTITAALLDGSLKTLAEHGVPEEAIRVLHVPGTFELPTGAQWLLEQTRIDGVICLGCVIKGETRHDEYISQAVATGLTNLALKVNKAVVFGVLTTENLNQAVERAGGKHGNKGVEAAVTALKMVALKKSLKENERKIGY